MEVNQQFRECPIRELQRDTSAGNPQARNLSRALTSAKNVTVAILEHPYRTLSVLTLAFAPFQDDLRPVAVISTFAAASIALIDWIASNKAASDAAKASVTIDVTNPVAEIDYNLPDYYACGPP